MMISLALAIAVCQTSESSNPHGFKVISIERSSSFAGRLGDRVELSLRISVGDHEDLLRVGRQHTRFGEPLDLKVGDRVLIHGFQDRKCQVVMADAIKIVRN